MLLSNNSSSKIFTEVFAIFSFCLKLNNIPYCWQVIKLLSEGKG